MHFVFKYFLLSLCLVTVVFGILEPNPYLEAINTKPWKSIQEYVEVRPGAHIFYWLYYADGTSYGATKKPLIIWIQGGPGLAASGLANFAEIGPLNFEFKPRNHTWVNGQNLLLIDHPVGTGFSYVTNNTLFAKTDKQMALDVMKTLKVFLRRHKEWRTVPTYIIGQSYGGKITSRLAYYLHLAIQERRMKMNIQGIAIGGGWVNPKESSAAVPDYLYNVGVIDRENYLKSKNISHKVTEYLKKRDYTNAGVWSRRMFYIFLTEQTNGKIIFNNINKADYTIPLESFSVKFNKYVKPTLPVDQNLNWSFHCEDVYNSLTDVFMTPSTGFLELLLNRTTLNIVVYNGNLDAVTPLAGASNWVHKLKWEGRDSFAKATRLEIRGHMNGHYKLYKNLSFWSVFGAGHWVPEDNPEAMGHILDYLMNKENTV